MYFLVTELFLPVYTRLDLNILQKLLVWVFFFFSGEKWESVFILIKLLHVFSYSDVQFNLFAFCLVTIGVSCDLP